MRVASIVAYALLALAGAHHVTAQDADEFDGVEAPVITAPVDTPSLPEFVPPPQIEHDYILEGGSMALAALYVINYFVGKSQNKKIAEKWLEASEPTLVKEFYYTGTSGNPSVGLLEESKDNFKYYCTGRRFCSRFVVDLALASRHDFLSRLWHVVLPTKDYLTIDVGLNANDLDPFVFGVTKKTQYTNVTKAFPELITISKRTDPSQIPESFCIASDNVETPKTALTPQLIKQLKALEPFLEYFVITDVNTLPITGFPKSERRILRVRFKMTEGSQQLDAAAAVAFTTHLIDAVGSTMKLSRDLKASAQKKRAKMAAERGPSEETLLEEARRQNEYKEKKRQEYEKMSYEEKQKYDEIQQNRQMRKRSGRKADGLLSPADQRKGCRWKKNPTTQELREAAVARRQSQEAPGHHKTTNKTTDTTDVEVATMEELLHPLLKVPFEKANKSFRLFHKHVSREIAAVQKAVFALQEEQPSAQHTLVQDTIESLELIAERIRNAQHDAKQFVAEQQKDINSCVLRAQYVHKYQAGSDTLAATAHAAARVPLGGTTASTWNLANVFTRTESQTMENDRLIADYLLSHGYIKSSKLIQETKGVEFVVDHDLHLQCHSIVNDLLSHNVSTAIAWCTENGSRLRRLQSQLEFQLRLQEFIELVRSDKKLEAIQYAQSNLTPISLQNEDEATRKTMMEAIQEAMATLAYKTPEQCGVEAYVQLFSKDRWQKLKDSFRTTFCMVYGIHSPPALCIALYAGISSLNTRTCRRYREETSSAKKRRRQDDDDDDDGEEEEHAVEVLLNASMLTEAERQEMGIQLGLQHKRHGEHEGAHHRSKKLKADQDSDASGSPPPPLCPTCSEVGGKLCGSLPFAHHPHSRLVCRVTQSVMDEHNPPMALPNGYVFSRRAIQQLTATEDSVDIVTCPVTEDRYQASQLKSVYIL